MIQDCFIKIMSEGIIVANGSDRTYENSSSTAYRGHAWSVQTSTFLEKRLQERRQILIVCQIRVLGEAAIMHGAHRNSLPDLTDFDELDLQTEEAFPEIPAGSFPTTPRSGVKQPASPSYSAGFGGQYSVGLSQRVLSVESNSSFRSFGTSFQSRVPSCEVTAASSAV
jgi:hypothetical protein